MKGILDLYQRLYYGLVITFSKSDTRAGQVASAASSLALFEAWYWFVAHLASDTFHGRVTSILSFRLELIAALLILTIANMVYFYPRHDRIAERLHGDQLWPTAFYVCALTFYATPILVLGLLLWLRQGQPT